ncbi:YjjG family noncanonical pyrimidine nucleotidase [Echinicola jeungdonensis]|uniref:YjjG family noncanonical pyrimidine nucleotidase n=1 Tax=Echinicola jeungdonensis TaxID=709343 RepID=A0ABV5J1U9_9BACT|nr:YjjG family noncanonical pyrimidine nucleotidase [Echinicola jeungdonensis]MDN3668946.1 YjjG family noncanonical pyrimidine nucleotidase [Echinicola jeungdonensis]
MKKYRHLFFDLDHTLWDYNRNVQESLAELYEIYALLELGVASKLEFYKAFSHVNDGLWENFNKGKIDKSTLRKVRFKMIFELLGLEKITVPKEMEADFLHRTSTKPHLFPHSKEILAYLQAKYELHIITNGFNESQSLKLNSSGLTSFFDLVVTAETTGHKKPDKRIFEFAISRLGTQAGECLMIGDNPSSDILGAKNAQIDQVFFNPRNRDCDPEPTYTITELKELEYLL